MKLFASVARYESILHLLAFASAQEMYINKAIRRTNGTLVRKTRRNLHQPVVFENGNEKVVSKVLSQQGEENIEEVSQRKQRQRKQRPSYSHRKLSFNQVLNF